MKGWPSWGILGAVAAGSALGALLRWALGEWGPTDGAWPWTLWWINVTGSALLGLVTGWTLLREAPVVAALVAPGLLGGFTSVSAASEEVREMLADDRLLLAGAWWGSMLVASVVAVHGGRWITERLVGGRR